MDKTGGPAFPRPVSTYVDGTYVDRRGSKEGNDGR